MTEEHHHHSHDDGKEITNENLAFCPVMEGTPVDKEKAEKEGRVREYEGKKYYLCCDACVTDFDSSPEKYTKS